jgi:hypothetical protein
MPNHGELLFGLQEGMAAETGVLDEPVTPSHAMHAMTEEAAEIPYFLGEERLFRVGVAGGREHQRMAASHTDILVVPIAIHQPPVRVVAEEARQRVPDASRAAIGVEVLRATATNLGDSSFAREPAVIDMMAPEKT